MLKEYIEKELNRVDNEFLPKTFDSYQGWSVEDLQQVKQFLTSSLTGLLDEIEKEVDKMIIQKENLGGDFYSNIMIKRRAYNKAINDVLTLLKKERGDVTKKVCH